MRKLIFFLILLVLINLVTAIETKEDSNYKVTFLIGSGITSNDSDFNVSSVMGEQGVGNYTDSSHLPEIGIWYTSKDILAPTISNLNNTQTTTTSSFIGWNCSESCNYTIRIYTDSARSNIFDIRHNNTFARFHNPFWNNLTASTTYFINLTVTDSSGNSAQNNTFNFTTLVSVVEEVPVGHIGGTGIGTIERTEELLAYPCPTDIPFIRRLTSTCKVPNNQICDDGEWFLVDKDCELDNTLFFSMWFLRIFLFMCILFLFKDYKLFPFFVAIFLILLFINGAFGILPVSDIPQITECEETGFNIIFSRCRIDNGICDYGEYPFKDNDCTLSRKRVFSGQIFREIWLVKLLLIASLVSLIVKRKEYAAIFALISAGLIITNKSIISLGKEAPCRGADYLINLGPCITPNYPMLGWALAVVIILSLYFALFKGNNKFFPVLAISLLVLLQLNGVLYLPPQEISEDTSCTGMNYFKNLDLCLVQKFAIEPGERCEADNPMDMLFSDCRIEGNGICDYGEYPFRDRDCSITISRVTSGQIFNEIWIIKFMMVIVFLSLFIKKRVYSALSTVLLLGLLAVNTEITGSMFGKEVSCEGMNYLINFGPCIAPSYPVIGWLLGLVILVLIYFIFRKLKSPGKEPKETTEK